MSQWSGFEMVLKWVQLLAYGTGPLACLFRSPVVVVDKGSNDSGFEGLTVSYLFK